ncbi:MAG: hypothetical protein ACOCWB_00790 [Bacteroidota bacterium]
MKNGWHICILFFCLLCFAFRGYSQEFVLAAEKKYSLSKKIECAIEPKIYLYSSPFFSFNKMRMYGTIDFSVNKWLSVESGVRVSSRTRVIDEDFVFETDNKPRIHFHFSAELIDNKIIELSYRYRFQTKIEPNDYEYIHRNRIKLEQTDYTDVKPYFSLEVFTTDGMHTFVKGECKLGIEHDIFKKTEMKEFLAIETEIKGGVPRMAFQVGIALQFD